MKIVYLVGLNYDDFSEGGFSILFGTTNEEKAIEVLEEKRKNDVSPIFGYKNTYSIKVLKLNERNEENVLKTLDI